MVDMNYMNYFLPVKTCNGELTFIRKYLHISTPLITIVLMLHIEPLVHTCYPVLPLVLL